MSLQTLIRAVFIGWIAVFFMACSPEAQPPHAVKPPLWYGDEKTFVLASYETVGFGEGASLAEAQAHAKEMIAQKLLSRVESSFESVSDNQTSQSKAKLKVTSDLALQELTTLKQERTNNLFYVALAYKNLDFAQRVKERLEGLACKNEDQNRYLARTPLFAKLNAALGCARDFTLHRQNKTWYLQFGTHLFLLGDGEFEELFVSKPGEAFRFIASKARLLEGESFHFVANANEAGYITLVDVYESGVVTLLQPSIKLEKTLRIPSQESAYEFEAGVPHEGRDTYDLYVAFFTQEPLDMSRFTYANEDFASDENAYKFDELLELMQRHENATLLLRTEAK